MQMLDVPDGDPVPLVLEAALRPQLGASNPATGLTPAHVRRVRLGIPVVVELSPGGWVWLWR